MSQAFGSPGFVDFWVALTEDSGWAIEVLRNGNRAEEQAKRFAEGGAYEMLPMTASALLDFRGPSAPGLRKKRAGFHHIIFADDYTSASVTRPSGDHYTISLQP